MVGLNRRDVRGKQAADIQARRAEKKNNQKTFGDERRRQIASHKKTVEGGKAADVRGTISLR